MKKRFLAILLFLLVFVGLKAQFDAQFSQYWASKTYYNPASVGLSSGVNALLIDRQQWKGMTNAPRTFYASADMPFMKWGKSQGVGIGLLKDNIGLFANSSVSINYAYKLKLWGGDLSIGSQLGFVNQSFDGTRLIISNLSDYHESNDDAIPSTNVQAMSFDMGLGVFYSANRGYVGLSVSHLLEPVINFDENSSTYIGRSFYGMGGGSLPLEGYAVELFPSFLVKSDFRVLQLDLTLRAEFNKRFWGGLSYRWQDAVVAMAGIKFKNVSIGYSYDITTSKLASVTGGSHELYASYVFQLQLKSDSKRKYNKSLRYL